MADKRFTFIQDTLLKADVFDGEKFVCCTPSAWAEQLVDLLNEIDEYNKRLIVENGILLNELVRLVENDGAKTSDYFNECARELYGEDIFDDIFGDIYD